MSETYIPQGYKSALSVYDTQLAIEFIKTDFPRHLCRALSLKRVSAPLFLRADTGLNDDLNGVERPVSFDVPATGAEYQIVHSLAKWKRWALGRYGFRAGTGLYTDMNAIRRDEPVLDNLHSVYVDQWDWEKVITRQDRTIAYLKDVVTRIVGAICDTSEDLERTFPQLPRLSLSREVTFVTTQELEDRYPDLTPAKRECEFTKMHPTVFLMQIGGALRSGQKHDGRAPDYDDWTLNGDIIFRNDLLGRAFEVSSMGIRVDAESLRSQLAIAGCEERAKLPFHKALLDNKLPLTVGGGIGQSRLCMLLMHCAHIGEVQSGAWDAQTLEACEKAGVTLM